MRLTETRVAVFDSALRENFLPLSLTRPTFDFLLGTCTLLDRIQRSLQIKVSDVIVPKYLERITKENHPELRVNADITENCIAVNALISTQFATREKLEKYSRELANFVLYDPKSRFPLLAYLDHFDAHELVRINSNSSRRPGVKQILSDEKSIPLLQFPWHLFEVNSKAIVADFDSLYSKQKVKPGEKARNEFELLGNKLFLAEDSEVGRFVTFDSREGPIIIDQSAEIQSFTHLTGPCYVGKRSIVKSARIREGTTIGNVCRISGEIEEAILFDYTNKNHEGFLGHSVVGSWVNLGALTSNSDLKNTYGRIKVNIRGKQTDTNSVKIGVFIGDMCKTAIGTMIYSGKNIGVASQLFGTVTEDVPSFSIYAKSLGAESKELYVESAVETQRRMMERRGLALSKNREELIKSVFDLTANERTTAKVKRGKFAFAS